MTCGWLDLHCYQLNHCISFSGVWFKSTSVCFPVCVIFHTKTVMSVAPFGQAVSTILKVYSVYHKLVCNIFNTTGMLIRNQMSKKIKAELSLTCGWHVSEWYKETTCSSTLFSFRLLHFYSSPSHRFACCSSSGKMQVVGFTDWCVCVYVSVRERQRERERERGRERACLWIQLLGER